MLRNEALMTESELMEEGTGRRTVPDIDIVDEYEESDSDSWDSFGGAPKSKLEDGDHDSDCDSFGAPKSKLEDGDHDAHSVTVSESDQSGEVKKSGGCGEAPLSQKNVSETAEDESVPHRSTGTGSKAVAWAKVLVLGVLAVVTVMAATTIYKLSSQEEFEGYHSRVRTRDHDTSRRLFHQQLGTHIRMLRYCLHNSLMTLLIRLFRFSRSILLILWNFFKVGVSTLLPIFVIRLGPL
jgi:hypothetical protein